MTYPTLSEVMEAVKKRDADILAMADRLDSQYGLIQLLTRRVADIESPKQFEKIGGE